MTARLDPPAWFSDEHRQIWADTVARLTDSGGLFKADPRVLETYVTAYASHAQAARLVAQTSVLISRDKGGPVENPALAVQRRCAADLAKASRALGLHRTPMADLLAESPMAKTTPGRWCDQHKRYECVKQRNKGGDCHQLPVTGLEACKNHGGKPLAVLKAEGQAARSRLYATPVDIDPGGALLDEVQWAAGHVGNLRERVAELAKTPGPDGEPGSGLWWGTVEELVRDGEVVERKLKAGPHAILAEYGRERDRLVKVAAAAHAAGAHDQAVNVAAALGAGARRLFDAIFAALDLTEDQQARVPIVVPEILAQFDTGTEGEAAGQG